MEHRILGRFHTRARAPHRWQWLLVLSLVASGLAQLSQTDRAIAATVFTPPDIYNGVAMPGDCTVDVSKTMQAWLQSLPAQSTVELGNRCYQIDSGIRLSFPQGLLIDGGMFIDPTSVRPLRDEEIGPPEDKPPT